MSHPSAAAVALAIAASLISAVAAQQRPTFQSETRLVVLHATVKNTRGELVIGLDRSAFTVYENGKLQPISLFRRDDIPVSLGILIDNSGSMRPRRSQVEAAALTFARASNPQDEIFVLNFGDKPRIDVPLTSDLRVLEAGIGRVDAIGGTAMRDAIAAGEVYLNAHAARDRKVLVVITDGNDNASLVALDRITRDAEQREITIYAIGLLNDEDPAEARRARHELRQLTDETGGAAYYPQAVDDLAHLVLDLARQIRNQYTIAYRPLNQTLDGSYRRLHIVVKGAERLSVRTRAGYRATPEREVTRTNQIPQPIGGDR